MKTQKNKNKNKWIHVEMHGHASLAHLFTIMVFFLMSFLLLGSDDFDEDESNIEFSGNIKSFNYIYHYFDDIPLSSLKEHTPYGVNSNKINVKLDYSPNDIFKSTLSYHIGTVTENKAVSSFNKLITPSSSYRAFDLPRYANDDNSETLFPQNLNRANFKIIYSFLELTVGRDALSKGSAKSINPTDLFSPFSAQALDTEEKIGVDLIRTRLNFGEASEVDIAYIIGQDFKLDKSAFLLSYSDKLLNSSIAITSIYFYENLLVGLDFNKEIKGGLFWLETAYVITNIKDYNEDNEKYLRLTTGFDYMFSNNLYFSVEYHFNQSGLTDLSKSFSILNKEAYTNGGVYLKGKHYIIPTLSYPISPLINSVFSAMINITDPSILGTIRIEYNIQENTYIDLNLFLRAGKEGFDSKTFTPNSEYGAYPNIYNLSLRIYF